MNLLLHHLRKDLRFGRWMILITLLLAAGVLWFPSIPLAERGEQIKWLYLSRYGSWLMLCLVVGHLIQLDAPLREGAYFRTRPALPSDLLGSKCLVVSILIVPMALFECLMLLLMGLRPGALELTLIFTENLLFLAAVAAVAMAMALREDSMRKFTSSIMAWGGILLISWIAFAWFQSSYLRSDKPDWSHTLEYLKTSRQLTAQFVALAGASIGIYFFVRSRRRETVGRPLLATTACVIATVFFWPLNFVKTFLAAQPEAPRSEWPDQTKLKANIDPTAHSPSTFIKYSGGYNEVRYQSINSYFTIDELSPDWFPASSNGYHSKIQLADGRTIERQREAWGSVYPTAILHQLKMKPIYPVSDKREWQAELSDFKLKPYARSLSGARLSGELLLPLKRAVILARAPLKDGLSINVPNRRIQIPKIEIIGDKLHCTILEESLSSSSRGASTRLSADGIALLIIQKDRGEFLQPNGGGQGNSAAGHYLLRKTDFEGEIFPPNENKPVTSDWLAGAEILIIGQESGGTLVQHFDFSNVNLSNER